MVRRAQVRPDVERFLDVLNNSSGARFAAQPVSGIINGDYPEGGLTGELMAKDLRLYFERVARAEVQRPGVPCDIRQRGALRDAISNRVARARRPRWRRAPAGRRGGRALVRVTHGRDYVQVRGGEGTRVRRGDAAGFEEHRHGPGSPTWMAHDAISLGTTECLDPVRSDDYDASGRSPS